MSFPRLVRRSESPLSPPPPAGSDYLADLIALHGEVIAGLIKCLREKELKIARLEGEHERMQKEIDHLLAHVAGAKTEAPSPQVPGTQGQQ
jgi:hypothetical protein